MVFRHFEVRRLSRQLMRIGEHVMANTQVWRMIRAAAGVLISKT